MTGALQSISAYPKICSDSRALIAIDLGAESCRVSLLRWQENIPVIQLVHRFRNKAVEKDGELRWEMRRILAELYAGLRQCAEITPEGVRSIGVDGWAVDYVRLDANGTAIEEPFCYRDLRTVASESAVHARLSTERIREITGIQISRINTLYQHVADKPELANMPWLNLPEYVLHQLGGEPVSELTNASHTQLLTIDGEWSHEIFTVLGLNFDVAPRLVRPGTDVGKLRGPLADLEAFSNTRLIAPACHDTASAVAAIPDAGNDWAYISSGTWSLVGTVLDAPVLTAESAAANFTNLAAAEGKICFHKSVNGLWLLRQCMEEWSAAGVELNISEVIDAAESISPWDYFLDVDDPSLMLQGDMPGRINAQLRRRGRHELDTSPAHAPEVASFILSSLAVRYAEVLKLAERLCDKQFTHLWIMGGGSQNKLLTRLTEEATGLKVRGNESEGSTLGNFAIQLTTLEHQTGHQADRNTCGWAEILGCANRERIHSVVRGKYGP